MVPSRLPLFFGPPNQLRHLVNWRSMLARFRCSLDLTSKKDSILKADPIDEVLKHWITSCINMFGERQVKLPCQTAADESIRWIGGEIRLHHKSVELGSSVTRASQLPSHCFPCIWVHIKIEPQVSSIIVGKVQIHSKASRAFVASRIKPFKFRNCSFDEIWMNVWRTDATMSELPKFGYYYLTNSLWILGSLMSLVNLSSSWYSVWRPGYLVILCSNEGESTEKAQEFQFALTA